MSGMPIVLFERKGAGWAVAHAIFRGILQPLGERAVERNADFEIESTADER